MVNEIHLRTTGPVPPALGARTAPPAPGSAFADVLAQVQAERSVRFSAHALKRLEERHITLSEADHARIARAVDLARAKGARESLLLMDRLALVVSVPNRTVITAVARNELEDAVFTNIDSAVVISDENRETAPPSTATGLDPVWGSPRVVER